MKSTGVEKSAKAPEVPSDASSKAPTTKANARAGAIPAHESYYQTMRCIQTGGRCQGIVRSLEDRSGQARFGQLQQGNKGEFSRHFRALLHCNIIRKTPIGGHDEYEITGHHQDPRYEMVQALTEELMRLHPESVRIGHGMAFLGGTQTPTRAWRVEIRKAIVDRLTEKAALGKANRSTKERRQGRPMAILIDVDVLVQGRARRRRRATVSDLPEPFEPPMLMTFREQRKARAASMGEKRKLRKKLAAEAASLLSQGKTVEEIAEELWEPIEGVRALLRAAKGRSGPSTGTTAPHQSQHPG